MVFNDFGTFSHFFDFIISGSECTCFSQSSYQRFFRGKRTSKICIFEAIILKKTEESDQTNLYLCVDFGSWTTTDFLEVNARVSWKVVTNGSFRSKRTSKISIFEAIILNQKWRSATEVIHVFDMVLEGLSLFQLYFFWKWIHAFYRK